MDVSTWGSFGATLEGTGFSVFYVPLYSFSSVGTTSRILTDRQTGPDRPANSPEATGHSVRVSKGPGKVVRNVYGSTFQPWEVISTDSGSLRRGFPKLPESFPKLPEGFLKLPG